MNSRLVMVFAGTLLFSVPAAAQEKTVTGKVTNEQGAPLAAASIVVKGTRTGTLSNSEGNYSIRAAVGQVLQFRLIGNAPEERTVGEADVIDVQLERSPRSSTRSSSPR